MDRIPKRQAAPTPPDRPGRRQRTEGGLTGQPPLAPSDSHTPPEPQQGGDDLPTPAIPFPSPMMDRPQLRFSGPGVNVDEGKGVPSGGPPDNHSVDREHPEARARARVRLGEQRDDDGGVDSYEDLSSGFESPLRHSRFDDVSDDERQGLSIEVLPPVVVTGPQGALPDTGPPRTAPPAIAESRRDIPPLQFRNGQSVEVHARGSWVDATYTGRQAPLTRSTGPILVADIGDDLIVVLRSGGRLGVARLPPASLTELLEHMHRLADEFELDEDVCPEVYRRGHGTLDAEAFEKRTDIRVRNLAQPMLLVFSTRDAIELARDTAIRAPARSGSGPSSSSSSSSGSSTGPGR